VALSIRSPHQNPVCTSPVPLRATCFTHHILLNLITRIFDNECRGKCSSLCSLLHSPVTSFLLGPNIFLSTLFSNTFSLFSSLNVRDRVSHPYKTTGNFTILYILIFIFLDCKMEHKRFCTEQKKNKAVLKFM
jgi:hypothetical protein